jgi:hypothetical protein
MMFDVLLQVPLIGIGWKQFVLLVITALAGGAVFGLLGMLITRVGGHSWSPAGQPRRG